MLNLGTVRPPDLDTQGLLPGLIPEGPIRLCISVGCSVDNSIRQAAPTRGHTEMNRNGQETLADVVGDFHLHGNGQHLTCLPHLLIS